MCRVIAEAWHIAVPAQRPVEAFVVAILPRAAGEYLYRLDANPHQLCSAFVDQKQYPG
jgi:hypothetical protein